MNKKFFGFDTAKQWDYENGFYLTSHLTRLAKVLAHFELYKSIVELPGEIVECGVFKGASLIRFATFREVLENPFSRKILGFDIFGKFPKPQEGSDATFVQHFEKEAGSGITSEELSQVLEHKSFRNVDLIPGDILTTVPQYVENHPELKIALLHIDVDVYRPAATILTELYDKVVTGGLVVFDDFATVAGETRAIDEFFHNKNVLIEKLPISHVPAYVRKT